LIGNLHTHTSFSDGSSKPERYLREALRQGFDLLGFSDHSPVPFANSFAIKNSEEAVRDYCDEILNLREKYAKRSSRHSGRKKQGSEMILLLGLEIDFIPGITLPIDHYRRNYPFDYFIGSVHLVKNKETGQLWFIDGPKISRYDDGLMKIFHGEVPHAVTAYYTQVAEMVSREKPDIIGHLDKIKMHNRGRFFSDSDPWYLKLVDDTLDVIRTAGGVIEVNTRGIYKKRSDSLFPGPEILKKILALSIPVTLASDAHKPRELSFGFPDAKRLLREIGFKETYFLQKGGWKAFAL